MPAHLPIVLDRSLPVRMSVNCRNKSGRGRCSAIRLAVRMQCPSPSQNPERELVPLPRDESAIRLNRAETPFWCAMR